MPLHGYVGTVCLDAPLYTLSPLASSPHVRYYETTILDSGARSHIVVGFSSADFKTQEVVGCSTNSVGYGSWAGNVTCESENRRLNDYGPRKWKGGDVIGAAIDHSRGIVFFTHNGRKLADVRVPNHAAYTVAAISFGTDATTERVRLNFGNEPFRCLRSCPHNSKSER